MLWKPVPRWCGGSEWSRGEIGKLKRRNGWPSDGRMSGKDSEVVEDESGQEQPSPRGKESPVHDCSLSRDGEPSQCVHWHAAWLDGIC